jgi:hypothetical protein
VQRAPRIAADRDEARERIERNALRTPRGIARERGLRRAVFEFRDRRGRGVDVGREEPYDALVRIVARLADERVEQIRFSAGKFADDRKGVAAFEARTRLCERREIVVARGPRFERIR